MRTPLALLCLLLCACIPQREPLTGTNGIRVEYASQAVIGGCNGQWHPRTSTIFLSYGAPDWVLAHEVAHAADSLGCYRLALRLVGSPRGLERQTALANRIADRADRLGGRLAYWRALSEISGDQAVASHPEILAALRVPSLIAKAKP